MIISMNNLIAPENVNGIYVHLNDSITTIVEYMFLAFVLTTYRGIEQDEILNHLVVMLHL